MHRTPSHIPLILPHECPLSRPVHDGRVIPRHEVARVLPFDTEDVFLLSCMRQELFDEICRRWLGNALERSVFCGRECWRLGSCVLKVVHVIGNVQIPPTGRFMYLQNAVAAERVSLGINIFEPGAIFWRGLLARVHYAVGADVVVCLKVGEEGGWELSIGGTGIGEVGVSAVAWGREFVGAEEGVPCSAGVEGGVDMEDAVPLASIVSSLYSV